MRCLLAAIVGEWKCLRSYSSITKLTSPRIREK